MPRNVLPFALLALAALLATVEILNWYSILSGTPLAISYTTIEGGSVTYTRSFGFTPSRSLLAHTLILVIMSMSVAVGARLLYRQRKA